MMDRGEYSNVLGGKKRKVHPSLGEHSGYNTVPHVDRPTTLQPVFIRNGISLLL